ncbi:hypothetical protein DFH09DRAFT_1188414, partial [Mycena vulgaris]
MQEDEDELSECDDFGQDQHFADVDSFSTVDEFGDLEYFGDVDDGGDDFGDVDDGGDGDDFGDVDDGGDGDDFGDDSCLDVDVSEDEPTAVVELVTQPTPIHHLPSNSHNPQDRIAAPDADIMLQTPTDPAMSEEENCLIAGEDDDEPQATISCPVLPETTQMYGADDDLEDCDDYELAS